MTCIFCKMIQGVIPVTKVYEDDLCICIRDINPQAKTHLLVIPKEHVESLDSAFPEKGVSQASLMGLLYERVVTIARDQGLLPGGFRTVINTNENGGQTVFHLHLHILGGERLRGSFA
ncbi:MAG: histidine triad nucleotide-binding protein [Bdellovibrionia bacterium]